MNGQNLAMGTPDRGTNSDALYQAEKARQSIANLGRVGKVVEVDYTTATAKVTFDGIITDWLPWTVTRAGGNRSWAAPELGEQVVVLSPSGRTEQGIIIGTIYQDDYPQNADSGEVVREDFGDGSFIEFDRANSKYTMDFTASGEFTVRVGANTLKLTSTGFVVTIGTSSFTLNSLEAAIIAPSFRGDIPA